MQLEPPAVADRKVLPKSYAPCRKPERALNKCMFEKLVRDSVLMLMLISYSFLPPNPQGLTKTIPGTAPGQTPIHEVENPLFGRMQK
jgi:NADH dehydrogenase (ubiquinone) 1 alpha subcomplex subunit 8